MGEGDGEVVQRLVKGGGKGERFEARREMVGHRIVESSKKEMGESGSKRGKWRNFLVESQVGEERRERGKGWRIREGQVLRAFWASRGEKKGLLGRGMVHEGDCERN